MSEEGNFPFFSETIISEGNLTRDPEDISRNKDKSVASFRIACGYRNRNGDEGTRYRSAICVNRSMAKNIIESASKGDRVVITGKIQGNQFSFTNRDGEEVEVDEDQVLVDSFGISVRFQSATSNRDSGRRGYDDDDDDDDDDEVETTPRRRRSAKGSSRRKSTGKSTRKRSVVSHGDDDDDDWDDD